MSIVIKCPYCRKKVQIGTDLNLCEENVIILRFGSKAEEVFKRLRKEERELKKKK